MKKVLLSIMVAFVAICLASCGKFNKAAGVNDVDSVAVDSLEMVEIVDSLTVDSVVVDSVVDAVVAE